MLLSWNHLFVTDSKQHKEAKPKGSLFTEVNLMRLSTTIPTVLLHYKCTISWNQNERPNSLLPPVGIRSVAINIFLVLFFLTLEKVVLEDLMYAAWIWCSSQMGFIHLCFWPACLVAWFIGWLAGWDLLWKYKGQCQKFSSCAQAERPCHVVLPLEN